MGPAWRGSSRGLGSAADSQKPWVSSGGEWQGAQSCQGVTELGLPGQLWGKCRVRRRAWRVSLPVR